MAMAVRLYLPVVRHGKQQLHRLLARVAHLRHPRHLPAQCLHQELVSRPPPLAL
eukprot:COSAG01_NODE_17256_length_1166_cov_1.258669_1_plen_53_part_10